MGKASSTKKVQRAARAGGRVSSGQPRSLLFPGVLTLIVVLGVALVVYARNDRLDEDLGGVPQLGDHIHQAFGVNVCGEWKPDLPEFESQVGIHTHGDAVLHIHPFSQLGVGANATLGRYFKNARDDGGLDVDISDTKLDYLDEDIEEGKTECEGVDDPVLLMAYWPDASDPEAEPEITTGGFEDKRLTENGAAITIYYGDEDGEIPKPLSASNLAALGAADGGSSLENPEDANTTTTSSVPGDSTTTTAGDGSTTTTTAGGSTTTTTAG
jgi:hypothetical protein